MKNEKEGKFKRGKPRIERGKCGYCCENRILTSMCDTNTLEPICIHCWRDESITQPKVDSEE